MATLMYSLEDLLRECGLDCAVYNNPHSLSMDIVQSGGKTLTLTQKELLELDKEVMKTYLTDYFGKPPPPEWVSGDTWSGASGSTAELNGLVTKDQVREIVKKEIEDKFTKALDLIIGAYEQQLQEMKEELNELRTNTPTEQRDTSDEVPF